METKLLKLLGMIRELMGMTQIGMGTLIMNALPFSHDAPSEIRT